MARGTAALKRTQLKPVSEKRRATFDARAACLAEVRRRARGKCEVRWDWRCERDGRHGHELLPRSAGGSPVDARNVAWCCPYCHRAIHRNPTEAYRRGWLVSRYGGEGTAA